MIGATVLLHGITLARFCANSFLVTGFIMVQAVMLRGAVSVRPTAAKAAGRPRAVVARPALGAARPCPAPRVTTPRTAQLGVSSRRLLRSVSVSASAEEKSAISLDWKEGDPTNYTLGILGDLHVDPRDLDHTYEGREHMKAILTSSPNPFLVSLGDLGESKDCTESKQLYAGTTDCFKLVREYLDGFETK